MPVRNCTFERFPFEFNKTTVLLYVDAERSHHKPHKHSVHSENLSTGHASTLHANSSAGVPSTAAAPQRTCARQAYRTVSTATPPALTPYSRPPPNTNTHHTILAIQPYTNLPADIDA